MSNSVWVDMLGGTVQFIETSRARTPTYRTRCLRAGAGDKPPLIFLHGLMGHAEAYVKNVVPLAEQFVDREVYAIDFVGTGYSDPPRGLSFSVIDYMDQVEDVIHALGYESAHLSGESLGSWVAGRLAIERPELIETLTLNTISGVYYLDTDGAVPDTYLEQSRAGLDGLMDRTMDMIDTGIPHEKVQNRMDWLFKSGETPDELVDIRHTIYSRPIVSENMQQIHQTFLEEIRDPTYYFTTNELEQIDVPTLVLHTEDNPSAHKALAKYSSQVIPDATYLLYEESGHWPQYEEYERFNADTLAFIKRHT